MGMAGHEEFSTRNPESRAPLAPSSIMQLDGRRAALLVHPTDFGGPMKTQPATLGQLRQSEWSEERLANHSVKQELRENLLCKLERERTAFPRHSRLRRYRDPADRQRPSFAPQFHFARPARAGQEPHPARPGGFSRSRIPYHRGCEIHDHPFRPICRACRDLVAEEGDATPIAWLPRDRRYVEKLATPDVTIADMIGDVDPIKAARSGTRSFRRAHHSLRPAAARQSRHLRHQRTARSRRKNSSRPVQHHAGRRRPD